MEIKYCANELKKVSLSMFRKNFFGVFHGSISSRIQGNQFLINKQNAIFDDIGDDDLILLSSKIDYRWNDASQDSLIHLNIYKNLNEAKFVCYAMPHYVTAYSLTHDRFEPLDYFGCMKLGGIDIYDPKNYDDWYERAPVEIYKHMVKNNTNIMVIRGYGVFAYNRTAQQLAKSVAIIENSCKLLMLSTNKC
ncbi:hypothetical protein LMG7974_00639 [Campylobacter majalis]|uniref:Class II aldolase/adducin N-terminal domain-containing protein n=1 Tax=Campylobacter majalis TaxID=2790656 RepID=A0ABN7K5H4_9BACT|nr:class II aldolase and adducin N-terminal domain-containing protein [Campylobacter majalis]CAD7287758.1 hypothetical protein LMG7974_00639 [Campylobacter majalis]